MDWNALVDQFTDSIPEIIGALAILIIGWLIAVIVSRLVGAAVRRTGLDRRISSAVSEPGTTARVDGGDIARRVVFWVIMLFVLVAFLQATGLTLVTEPLTAFLATVLAFIPKLIGALVLLLVAWIIARILRAVVVGALTATQLDERLGTATPEGSGPLTRSIGEIVYWLVFLFFLPAILGALDLEGLLAPVEGMINTILAFVPRLVAAALLLAIAFFVGRVLAQIVTGLLTGIGFNSLPARLGIGQLPTTGNQTPASLVGQLVLVLLLLFASMQALAILGLAALAAVVLGLLELLGRVVLGLIIFGVGFYLARLAARAIRAGGTANSGTLAMVAQGAILALAGAMALREMGFAEEIINLAFGLTLGALAVAAALAFGLGGREVAARHLHRWTEEGQSGPQPPSVPPTTPPAV